MKPPKVSKQQVLATQLPIEIVGEILHWAINPETGGFLSPDDIGTDRHHFKALRSVCRLWRAAAFATPSLWTVVWVDFKGCTSAQVQVVIDGVRHYFSHASHTLPLTLGFRWQEGSEYPSPAYFPSGGDIVRLWEVWLNFVFDFRDRWIELSIFTTAPLYWELEDNLRVDRAKGGGRWVVQYLQVSLKSLPLHFDAYIPEDGETIFRDSFPQLKTIIIDMKEDTLVSTADTYLLAPHPNVTKINATIYTDCNVYLSRLSGFPKLKRLVLGFGSLRGVIPALETGPTIDLPDLNLLRITFPSSFIMLSRLRAPNLHTLELVYYSVSLCAPSLILEPPVQPQLAGSFHHFVAFVQQCSTTLRSLSLNTWFLEDDYLLTQLLESLESVEFMCIDTWFVTASETKSSLQRKPVPFLLPKLRGLCLHHHDDWDEPEPHTTDDDDDSAQQPPSAHTTSSHKSTSKRLSRVGSFASATAKRCLRLFRRASSTKSASASPQGADTQGQTSAPGFTMRGRYSWPSLGALIVAAASQGLEEDSSSPGGAMDDSSTKFTLFASSLARRAGGEEARRTIRELGCQAGVRVVRKPLCDGRWGG